MPVKFKVTVEGHRDLMRKLRADVTLAPPMRGTYERIGQIGQGAGRAAAPVGPSGNTRSLLTYRVMGKKIATAVSIRTTATRSSARYRRYPYPKRLNYDARSKHRQWLDKAIKGAWGRIASELRRAEHEIQSRFNAG